MKKFGANIFLFSILMGLIILPIASFKLTKVEQTEVLGKQTISTKYLQQKIKEQSQRIKDLETELKEAKETTQSTESN